MSEEKKVMENENGNQEEVKTQEPEKNEVTIQQGGVPAPYDSMSSEEKKSLWEKIKELLRLFIKNQFTVYGHLEELGKRVDDIIVHEAYQEQRTEEQAKEIAEIKTGLSKIIEHLEIDVSSLPGYKQQDAERLLTELKYNVDALMPDTEKFLTEIFNTEYGNGYLLAFNKDRNELILYNPDFMMDVQEKPENLPECLCISLDSFNKTTFISKENLDMAELGQYHEDFMEMENGMDFCELSASEKTDYIKNFMCDVKKQYENEISKIERDKDLFELEQDEHEIA